MDNINIELTTEYGKPIDNDFQYGADDVKYYATVDGIEYTGIMSYWKLKDEYEVQPDDEMPEDWEDFVEALQNKLTETLGALK
jgi:hypothetical protein